MRVAFVRPELHSLDEVVAEAVAVGIFSDERPLTGLAGLLDWRLNGALTAWIKDKRFTAQRGDALLYPERGRLSFASVLLFGLGDALSYNDADYRDAARRLLSVLKNLGVRRFAAPLPGRQALTLNPRQLVDGWLAAVRDVYLDEPGRSIQPEVFIVEDTEIERVAGEAVQGFLRRLAHNRSMDSA